MRKIIAAAVAVFALLGVCVVAPAATSTTKASTTKAAHVTVVCPVTGETVANVSKAKYSVYRGKKYYFCCPSCKAKFDAAPAKYVKALKSKSHSAAKKSMAM